MNGTVNAGDRRRVHYNLHIGGFSVVDPSSGRVIAHVDDITLTGVEFRVQPSGLRRIRETGQRAVCAYAIGTVEAVDSKPDLTGCTRVSFNPHKADTFMLGTRPVTWAERVTFADDAGWLPARAWTRIDGPQHPRWEIKNPVGDGQNRLLTDHTIRTYGRAHVETLLFRLGLPPLPEQGWVVANGQGDRSR